MTRHFVLVGGALLGALPALVHPVAAQDIPAGRKVAAGICQACHGIDGLATMPEAPNLAGMDATYLAKQLAAFRAGERQNEMMQAVVGMLDDKKSADVVAYYAAIEITVTKLPGQ